MRNRSVGGQERLQLLRLRRAMEETSPEEVAGKRQRRHGFGHSNTFRRKQFRPAFELHGGAYALRSNASPVARGREGLRAADAGRKG
ncbi:MAG TPA: hypothetical protein VFP68_04285 [Burkholderiaceae bacterium]|nr:hypothetical protein [Burkholderiaceae bacterium]